MTHCMLPLALLALGGSAAAQTQLVAPGSTWKYLDDGSDQGTAWRAPSFDDSGWASGPAQLGYGDGDEATVVSFGPNSNDKYITTYFRHDFSVPNPSTFVALKLRLLRDDGAVVYLNGLEIARDNLPTGAVDFSTTALSAVSGSSEDAFYASFSDAAQLVAGTNTLAVEIHQSSGTSSDISLDFELLAFDDRLVTRGPYLQLGTPASVRVRWRSFPASDGRLWYGDSPGNLVNVIDDATITTEHEIELTGLAPDTRYYYAVGDTAGVLAGDDPDHFFDTHPVAGTTGPFRAWILGDSGTASTSAELVREAYYTDAGTTHTDLWLMLGDNAYTAGTDAEYQAAVFEMYPEMLRKSVLWPTRGNHEQSASTFYGIFSLPAAGEAGGLASGTEAYYSYDYANVHFICLDSFGSDRSMGGAMWTWLQADLAATDQEWIVAYWHHPPYSKGSHDSDTEDELIEMRENFLPLLESGGVDVVLAGHSHSYERSFLIDGHYDVSSTFGPSHLVDGGDGREAGDGAYNKAAGVNAGAVYFTAGSSGKVSVDGTLDHPAMFHSEYNLGSVVMEVDGGRMDLEFLKITGQVSDHVTLLNESYEGRYCVGQLNGDLCVATLSAVGTPSVTSASPFEVIASHVTHDQNGILFYGFSPQNIPWQSGRLCVGGSLRRTPAQNSGGTPCDGVLTFDFNAWIQSGVDPNLVAGAVVYCQYWHRDTGFSTTALSDAYQFVIRP